MRPDITSGGTFPDHELPDHESVPRRLSEIQGDDPMILTLARPGRTVKRDLDIQEYTDPDNDPMIPHTLVLNGWDRRAEAAESSV